MAIRNASTRAATGGGGAANSRPILGRSGRGCPRAGTAATNAVSPARNRRRSVTNHLIRARQHRLRYVDAEYAGSTEVDDQFDARGQLDRQFTRAGALQYSIDVKAEAAINNVEIRSVGGDETGVGKLRPSGNSQQPLLERELRDARPARDHPRILEHDDALHPRAPDALVRRLRILAGQDLHVLGFEIHPLRGGERRRKLGSFARVLWIGQDRDASNCRRKFPQYLEALADQFQRQEGHAGGVASRARIALRHPGDHRIAAEREHDGHPTGDQAIGQRSHGGLRDDQCHALREQLVDGRLDAIAVVLDDADFDADFVCTNIAKRVSCPRGTRPAQRLAVCSTSSRCAAARPERERRRPRPAHPCPPGNGADSS